MSDYVPQGYQRLETAFLEFISARFIQEMKDLWEHYARIHKRMEFGISEVPANPREHWQGIIQNRYSPAGVPSLFIDRSGYVEPVSPAQEHRREHLRNLRLAGLVQRIGDDGDYLGDPTSYDRCLDLLEGVEVYWERKKEELATAFREPFVNNFRRASALSADGTQMPIPPAWWCGSQCTEALVTLSCQHPNGDIIEKLLSKAEANTPERRVDEALEWLRIHGETVKDWPDEARLDRFRAETPHFMIAAKAWKTTCKTFLEERPDLKGAWTKPGPRRLPL